MNTRRIGLLIFSLCTVVTLAAVGLALSRGPSNGDGAGAAWGAARAGVALIKLDGPITDAMVAPFNGVTQNVYAQLQRAERDDAVKAVVLRVNSPGGSAPASQALYNQITRLRAAGKPVVVHFTDVAASGGYYVGAAGDRIVAQPATITGSIGVIIVSLDTRELEDKVGVRQRVIKSGPYKDILSGSRDISPEEQAIIEKLLRDTLDQFVQAVATGRNLPEAEVRGIADGRVFSGSEALALKLVDEVGDQHRAIELAGELAGLTGEPRLILYERPQPGGLLSLLGGRVPGSAVVEQILPSTGIGVHYEWR